MHSIGGDGAAHAGELKSGFQQRGDLGLLFRAWAAYAKTIDAGGIFGRREAGQQPGLRAGTAGCVDNCRVGDPRVAQLSCQFQTASDIAQGTHGIGASDGNPVGFVAVGAKARAHIRADRVHVRAGRRIVDDGTKQPVEQQVAAGVIGRVMDGVNTLEHHVGAQSQPHRRRHSLSHVVRLGAAGGDDRVGALMQCVSYQEFQFARFVAAAREAGAVVTFDP